MINYRKLNYDVMTDTKRQYETNPYLIKRVQESIRDQFMVSHEDSIDQPVVEKSNTQYSVTSNRSFHEAKQWVAKGFKVAVLNFANNHSVGGAPFSAGAQEESLCRCSTLLPCLTAMLTPFYHKHSDMFNAGKMDFMGNDDLIYTPNICVFKTDINAEVIEPQMMPEDEWYSVDVITCAAPQLRHGQGRPADYEAQMSRRIKKILDVAARQGAEVLVLGAWGCGAFRNPSDVIARLFREQLQNYDFKQVAFAMSIADYQNTPFYSEFMK